MQTVKIRDQNCRPANGALPAPRILWLEAFCIAAVVLLQFGPRPAQLTLVLLLMAWALTSAHGIIQSLSLIVLILQANPGLAAVEPRISVLKWVLIFICLVRIALAGKWHHGKGPAWLPWFGVFVGVTTILALLVSYDSFLSGFKLISFAAGAIVALLGIVSDTRSPRYWLNWFFTVHCVVVFLSVPVLFLPAGYLRAVNRSFQGIFADPQAFGVYLAIWCSYLVTYLVTSRRVSPFLLFVTGLTAYFVVASHCRGAMLAIAVSAVISGLTALFSSRVGLNYSNPWTIARLCTIVLFAVCLVAYEPSGISAGLKGLTLKGYTGNGDNLIALLGASFEESRGEQVRSMVESIAVHPLAGVGFGVAPLGVLQVVERDPIFGLPVSAPLEQGFLPLAVLAQIGIIGALVLGAFLSKLTAPLVKFAPAPALAMFITSLLINMGEMIFFSTGGIGLQMWLILGLCYEYAICEGRLVEGPGIPHGLRRRVFIRARRKGISYAR
jgi:hypothetical protein